MKSTLTLLLSLVMIIAMTACTPRDNGNNSSSAIEPSSSLAPSSSSEPSSMDESKPSSALEDESAPLEDEPSTTAMSTDFEKIGALENTAVTWGPGVQVDENNRTLGSIQMQEQYEKYCAYFIAPETSDKVYLTFDEGYENGYTSVILDVLKEKQVSAVFFVTMDYVKTQPELVQRMIDEGHIVGNHSTHHPNFTAISPEKGMEEIKELHDYMLENYSYQMTLFRPPEGAFSVQSLSLAQSMGYQNVFWSFAYADWDPNNQVGYDAAFERTTKFIHPGAIYLLHAVSKDNSQILGPLIDEIRARGLTVAEYDLPYIPVKS